jgi:hypothetical protein
MNPQSAFASDTDQDEMAPGQVLLADVKVGGYFRWAQGGQVHMRLSDDVHEDDGTIRHCNLHSGSVGLTKPEIAATADVWPFDPSADLAEWLDPMDFSF